VPQLRDSTSKQTIKLNGYCSFGRCTVVIRIIKCIKAPNYSVTCFFLINPLLFYSEISFMKDQFHLTTEMSFILFFEPQYIVDYIQIFMLLSIPSKLDDNILLQRNNGTKKKNGNEKINQRLRRITYGI
jgi:hypothetical protein